MEKTNLETQIDNLKNEYYKTNKKAVIFKTAQKNEFAENVNKNISLNVLLNNTILTNPATNEIYISYPLFKTFAQNSAIDIIIDDIMTKINNCIQQYGSFKLHVNMQTFSATGAQRYKHIIEQFCIRCLKSETEYSTKLENIFLYHSPKMIVSVLNIFSSFVDPCVLTKMSIEPTKFVYPNNLTVQSV